VILETLRSIPVPDIHHDLSRVLAIISRLGEDPEPSVRAELMEQVPHVAMYCHEEKDEHQWMHLVPSFLLPLVVRYLTDVNNQVRKTAQAALLVLLEQELVAHDDVEDQVCPLLLMLTNAEAHDDFRTEAAALLCRMAPLLGGDLTQRVFLNRFAQLASDGLFHVRKILASNFGEFCAVVGQEITEAVLLEKFYALCQDELWGVRKACAEVFMSISRVVSQSKRRQDLGVLFVNLLQDESRWVRMAAFQALGPFISTFSRPHRSPQDEQVDASDAALDVDDVAMGATLGAAAEVDPDFNSFTFWRDPLPELDLQLPELSDSGGIPVDAEEKTAIENLVEEIIAIEQSVEAARADDDDHETLPAEAPEVASADTIQPSATSAAAAGSVSDSVEKALEDLMARVELGSNSGIPESTQNAPLASGEPESVGVHQFDLRRVACQELQSDSTNDLSSIRPDALPEQQQQQQQQQQGSMFQPNLLPPAYVKSGSSDVAAVYSNSFYTYYPARRRSDGGLDSGRNRPYSPLQQPTMHRSSQNIVPQNLMDYYLQMTDPYFVETVDAEITRHCAFSLPAVVSTLGREHWPILRDLYGLLASDMQWKVRRTLASSIHEIGGMLGQQVVTQDLLPVFDGFMKDLDEVRIGVLKHLSDFLALLAEKERRQYLPRLSDFLKLDNEQNWRFRQELALQLQTVTGLFTAADSAHFLLPLALTLAADRVAAVRLPAFTLVSQIMKQVSENNWEGSSVMLGPLLVDLTTKFCSGNRWMLRQSYVNICNQLVTDRSLPLEEFAKLLLEPLLALKQDRVPNVRLVLARVINLQLKYHEFFAASDSPYRTSLDETLTELSADLDRDVSYYATMKRHPGADVDYTSSSSSTAA